MMDNYESFGRHIAAILTGRSPHDAGLADEIIRAAKNAGIITERELPLQHGSTTLFPRTTPKAFPDIPLDDDGYQSVYRVRYLLDGETQVQDIRTTSADDAMDQVQRTHSRAEIQAVSWEEPRHLGAYYRADTYGVRYTAIIGGGE